MLCLLKFTAPDDFLMRKTLLSLLALTFLATSCIQEEPEQYSQENLPRASSTILPPGGKADRPEEALSFEEFLGHVFCEEDGRICVVDGDTPITGGFAGLREFYDTRVQPSLNAHQHALSVNLGDRGDDLWYGDQRLNLSFCVSNEFGERKAEVVEATLEAVAQWEEIASVRFPYRADQDGRCTINNRQVLFPIWPAEDDAPYFARAFFPSFEEHERDIRINFREFDAALEDPEMYTLTLAGVMRHELGHVLGFRHEHTRDEAGAYYCFEDRNYRPGTFYDSESVMHYPWCEGSNDWSLEFSATDLMGASYFYPPEGVDSLGRCERELDSEGNVLESCEPVVRQITEFLSKFNANIFLNWTGIPSSLWETIQRESMIAPLIGLDDLRDRIEMLDVEIRQIYDFLFVDGRCPGVEFYEDQWIVPYCYPVVNRILELANNASFDELNDVVRLDRRAAQNIVAAREVRPIDSYDALISLGYVKRQALWSMYTYLYPNWEAEQEWINPDEEYDLSRGCSGVEPNSISEPNCGDGPLTVAFNAIPLLGSLDYADPRWDFGDGRTARGVQVEHTYLFAGEYEATFSATITGQGWGGEIQLGKLTVVVLSEHTSPDPSGPFVVSEYHFFEEGDGRIAPGEMTFFSVAVEGCPVQVAEPWIVIDLASRTKNSLSFWVSTVDTMVQLVDQTYPDLTDLGYMLFPQDHTPVEDLGIFTSTSGNGFWYVDVENLSADEEIQINYWGVSLLCAHE